MSEIEHGGNSEAAAGPSGFGARHWHKLAAATIWMLLIAFFWLYINQPVDAAEGAALASGRRGAGQAIFDLILFMQETVYGPVIFILLYTLRPLAFFSAALLTIAGGFLFGPLGGVLATVIGANLSASLAYVVGRVLGSGVLDQENSAGVMRRYASRMRNNSFETILIMRFVFLPYDTSTTVPSSWRRYSARSLVPSPLLCWVQRSLPTESAISLSRVSFQGLTVGCCWRQQQCLW